MMNFLEKAVEISGKAVAWLTLAMVLLTFTVVVLRYGFSLGWIWLQESVTYMHAIVFMAAAAWTLQDGGHVRVDIVYRERGPFYKACVNMAGTLLFLVPVCVFLIIDGWEYVASSWRLMEKSREAGGLPLVFVLKSLILVLPVLLLAQSLPDLVRSFRVLKNNQAAEPTA